MTQALRTIQAGAWLRVLAIGASLGHAGVHAIAAGAGAPPSYGHDFVTVGAPGNRAALESERYYGSAVAGFPNLGAVNYAYRISRTETTTRQWFDFVQVFWPFADKLGISRLDQALAGGWINASNLTPGTHPGWYMPQGTENLAIETSFRFSARYVNWLHNGKPTTNLTFATFDQGAYDMATLARQPGAKYWIPSLDEWTKAVYYDPNRYGEGQEGYWLHSGMSAVPLVGGPPGSPGAQTSAGGWWHGGLGPPPSVGAYPQTLSPWGLLDTSGGVAELTDTLNQFGVPNERVVRGQGLGPSPISDRLDYLFSNILPEGTRGLRIASLVPTGAPLTLFGIALLNSTGRRRRAM